MGFCLLNSVAIAAINALNLPNVNRVAILDFDVHHGNGTVDCVENTLRFWCARVFSILIILIAFTMWWRRIL